MGCSRRRVISVSIFQFHFAKFPWGDGSQLRRDVYRRDMYLHALLLENVSSPPLAISKFEVSPLLALHRYAFHLEKNQNQSGRLGRRQFTEGNTLPQSRSCPARRRGSEHSH